MSGTTRRGRGPSRGRVVVVGGGLAGITSALACADAGAQVTLYESRRSLGGAAASLERYGLEVDVGQHVFLRCCTAYRRLLQRLGSAHHTLLQDRLDIVVLHPDGRRGRLRRSGLPAPFHLATALCTYPFLSPLERGRAAVAALGLRRLDMNDRRLDERSFGDWLTAHRQSREAVRSLWDLIGLPTLNLRAEEASLQLATRVFQTGLLDRTDAADIGISRVSLRRLHSVPALATLRRAGVDVHLGEPVRTIVARQPFVGVATKGGTVDADAVICAVPPQRAVRLLPPGALRDPAALTGLGTSAIVTAHVVYDRPVMPRRFVAALDSPVQWTFDRSRQVGLPDGRYVVVTLSGADDWLREPVAALRRRLVPALATLLPTARSAHVERFFVTRDRAATFRQAPGTARLRPGPQTGRDGIYLAGSYTDTGWPATMESAVLSGSHAARRALDELPPGPGEEA